MTTATKLRLGIEIYPKVIRFKLLKLLNRYELGRVGWILNRKYSKLDNFRRIQNRLVKKRYLELRKSR
jgi:hypothetical protein